jgi:hypothetical protein
MRRPLEPRTLTARQAVAATLLCLAITSLLSSRQMVESAERMPFGTKRDVALGVAHGFDRVSAFLSLDRPRQWLFDVTGHDDDPGGGDEVVLTGTTPTIDPTPETVPGAAADTTTTAAPPDTRPVISAERKLRVYVGGDSMARELGESLLDKTNSDLVDAELDFQISSGLARPDYYNWPAHLQEVTEDEDAPDAVIVLFGANDGQNMERDGDVLDFGSPEWLDEYHLRVGAAMDVLYHPHRTVYWVGMPVCRDGDYSQRMQVANQVYAEEAAKRPWVRTVDTYKLFVDADGNYADYLPTADGTLVLMRQSDGIHWSRAGGDRVADAVLELVRADWPEIG